MPHWRPMSAADPGSTSTREVPVAALAGQTIELWPQTMAPGYYNAVIAACRDAGFEPRADVVIPDLGSLSVEVLDPAMTG